MPILDSVARFSLRERQLDFCFGSRVLWPLCLGITEAEKWRNLRYAILPTITIRNLGGWWGGSVITYSSRPGPKRCSIILPHQTGRTRRRRCRFSCRVFKTGTVCHSQLHRWQSSASSNYISTHMFTHYFFSLLYFRPCVDLFGHLVPSQSANTYIHTKGFSNGHRLFTWKNATEDLLDARDITPMSGQPQTTGGRHVLIKATGYRLQNGLTNSCNFEYPVVSTLTTQTWNDFTGVGGGLSWDGCKFAFVIARTFTVRYFLF